MKPARMKKFLVVSAHPDDEVLGCGGTIKRLTSEGHEVHLCFITKAYTPDWSEKFLKDREQHIKNACAILGVKKFYKLDFPTAKLDTVPQKSINDALGKVVREIEPHTVFLPFGGDLNIDHRITFECGLVVCRPINGCTVKQLYVYEALSETEWGIQLFQPTLYMDITQTIDDKWKAMQAYTTELKDFPHPRSREVIEALAVKRGSEAGLKRAEAFTPIRLIDEL